MRRIVSSLLILGALAPAMMLMGCGRIGFDYQKQLSGKYELVAVDVLEQMDVSQSLPSGGAIGVIPPTVYSVGWDEHFIIAKQHPNDASHHIDKSVTNFYILQVSNGTVTGPLVEVAFTRERAKLGVPASLSFTLSFDSLK